MRAEPYTPAALLNELADDLKPWVEGKKGTLSVARDPYHFLELLAESPAGWRAVLHWDGDANLADDPQTGAFCPQKISVGVTANLGLTAEAGQSLRKASASRPALLTLLAEVRDRVRGYAWPDEITGRYSLYKGTEAIVLPDSGIPLAGYRLTFELLAALPPVDYRNLS